MNYPKPEIFDPKPFSVAPYISVPGYKTEIILSTKMSDYLRAANEFLSSMDRLSGVDGSNEPAIGVVGSVNQPVEPIEICIENKSNQPIHGVSLFHSYMNRVSLNFGNHASIFIGGPSPRSYLEYLTQLEHRPCIIGAIRYEIISKPDSVSDITIMESFNLRYGRVDANGMTSPVYYVPLTTSPQRFIQSIVQVQAMAELMLDGWAGFNIYMPPNTELRLSFYPLAQRMTQRLADPELLQQMVSSREERAISKMERKLAKLETRNQRRGSA